MSNPENPFLNYDDIHTKLLIKHLDNAPESAPLLYHYTSIEAAQKILESRKLRLTNIRYLNDPQELLCGLDILEQAYCRTLQKIKAEGSASTRDMLWFNTPIVRAILSTSPKRDRAKKMDSIFNYAESYLAPIKKYLWEDEGHEWSLYIASFSEKNDDLRQWIPYALNGRGVALGIDVQLDETGHRLTLDEAELVRCSYAPRAEKLRFAEDVLYHYYTWLKEGQFDDSVFGVITVQFMRILMADLAACKTSEYSDEQEWRIYRFIDSVYAETKNINPEFCVSNNLLKPYYLCTLNPESLKSVHLGPLSDELNIDSFEYLLKKHDFNTVVSHSKLPYRG